MTSAEKRYLRAQAHTLKPVVMIGHAGLTAAILAETDIVLDTHELIKVKIRAEKEDRKLISEQLCDKTGADLIQAIGQIVVIYRPNPNKKASAIQIKA